MTPRAETLWPIVVVLLILYFGMMWMALLADGYETALRAIIAAPERAEELAREALGHE